MASKKQVAARRIGRAAGKSRKPLRRATPRTAGKPRRRRQNKPWDEMPDIVTDIFASRADAGATGRARRPKPLAGRGVTPKNKPKTQPKTQPRRRRAR